jgi:hypothetical protein
LIFFDLEDKVDKEDKEEEVGDCWRSFITTIPMLDRVSACSTESFPSIFS